MRSTQQSKMFEHFPAPPALPRPVPPRPPMPSIPVGQFFGADGGDTIPAGTWHCAAK